MAAKEEIKSAIINELTLHIEKLEMDNEIHIIKEELQNPNYEAELQFILRLKNILGKLIQNIKLDDEDTKTLEKVIKDKNLIYEI
ncbi:hypothetical protein M2651_10265 [Clostridium sp. SYSU_GA19001]|uniref:hypothetical protein n=1 Tax=Clostridium caldaquaticum TaxID=2940653 RepID=UPI0020775DB2|nr:hypothetical protein [Clostridium caldaquaticum]MCM8711403.1 hypothetical protein [Clostridium caldaquaticum]